MKYFKNDAEENSEDKEISLDFALKEIDKESKNEGNFIGFTNENGETIQFIREGEDDWLIDFPTPEKEYVALQDSGLTTEKVKEIVKMFSLNQNWRSLCKLTPITDSTLIDLTTKLCPFFKTNCKGNQCVMCRDGQCLVVNYLRPSNWEEVPSGEGQIKDAKPSLPEWLKTGTPEDLAQKIMEFKEKEFPTGKNYRQICYFFRDNEGLNECHLPPDIDLKLSRAEDIVSEKLAKAEIDKKKAQLEKERKELPSLVDQCIIWATDSGLKRVTLPDIDAFILQKDLDILYETKRTLYSMVNVKLKRA